MSVIEKALCDTPWPKYNIPLQGMRHSVDLAWYSSGFSRASICTGTDTDNPSAESSGEPG